MVKVPCTLRLWRPSKKPTCRESKQAAREKGMGAGLQVRSSWANQIRLRRNLISPA